MNDQEFNKIMEHIVASIKQGGYEPYDQLYGYVETGEDCYITRTGNARELIKSLDKNRVKAYVLLMKK